MTLSSGAGLKKVKAQAGRSKSVQALKRKAKVLQSPAEAGGLVQTSPSNSLDDQQVSSCSTRDQRRPSADNWAPDIQSALVDHTGLADVLSSAGSTAFGFPLYTNPLPAASPYRQRLEEIQHRRAESERFQRALASNSHLQLVVFCHRNDAYNFLPDGASITDMGVEQTAGDNLLTAHATISEAKDLQSAGEDEVSRPSSDKLHPSGSVEARAPISTRKKHSKKQARAIAKKSDMTLESSTDHTQSQGLSLAESQAATEMDHNVAGSPAVRYQISGIVGRGNVTTLDTQTGGASRHSKTQQTEPGLVEASPVTSWDDQPLISASTVADKPFSSPLLSPQHQVEGRRKPKNSKGVPRMGSTPSSSRPSSRISGTTDASEASELDLGQFLLSSQAPAAVASRSVTETTTKAQRRRAKMKQSSRIFDAQNAQAQDAKGTGDLVIPAERTHQVRRIHIGPLPQPSPESSRQRSPSAANTHNASSAPTISSKSRVQGKAMRTSSSASSSQPPSATSWKVKGTSEDLPNHTRSYTTESTGQLTNTDSTGASKNKKPPQIEESTSPVVLVSGSSSTATEATQTRNRSVPGAPPAALASNNEITISASKPQREKERIRLARERKQQELHRRRIAEAVAAAERGEKLSIPSQEVQRDAEAVRHKKFRPVVSVPPWDVNPTDSTASAEVLEGFSPRSRESAISKAETDDSYHTAASNIQTSSPAPKSPREGSESNLERQSDEGELKDSSSVRSDAPSMLFSPLSTGSATITCFSPLQTPLAVDAPPRPHWYPELEHGQSSHCLSLSKHAFSLGGREHSPSNTDTTDASEVTGSQYGPSPPSDSSIDFGYSQSNALTERRYPMQSSTGADLTSSKLNDFNPDATTYNDRLEDRSQTNRHPVQWSGASSCAPLEKTAGHVHTIRGCGELVGQKLQGCSTPTALSVMVDQAVSVFSRQPMTDRLHQQGLPSSCSIHTYQVEVVPHRGLSVTTDQNFIDDYRQPSATASPPSSLTVIPEPLDSNGIEVTQRGEAACDTRRYADDVAPAGQPTSVFPAVRTKPQAVHLRCPPPAQSMLPTAAPDLRDPEQLSAFRRCVSELNAFEKDHQRRSRAREERLARLHCYDLEGFIETKRMIVETDGPSKGRKRIVRLWRTHSMLAPGRRLSAKFDFDPSVPVAASKGSHRPNATAVSRAQVKDNVGTPCIPNAGQASSQSALAASSSLPDNLSQLLGRRRRPAFTPHCDISLLACDTSECNASRGSGIPDPLIEHDCSLNGIRVIRPSGIVRSILEDASVSYAAPFEDTTESVIKSGSTNLDTRPDLKWLDSLQCLDEPERTALRCFLKAQGSESDHLSGTCLDRGDDASEQVPVSEPVALARIPSIYPTMGNVTGPNGQQAVGNDWDMMGYQLRRSASNVPAATIWHPEPSSRYEMATSAMSSPHGSLSANGHQAPHYERHYSSSPHLLPMSSYTRPAPLPTAATGQGAHSRDPGVRSAWSPVPPSAQSYHSDGSELAYNAGPTSPHTEPEAQMEALVAAVQRCLSADGHEGGGTDLSENQYGHPWPSEPASDDLASRYASSSAAEDRASSAGETPVRNQGWISLDENRGRRSTPSKNRLTPYAGQQQGQSTYSSDPWRDIPSSAHPLRVPGELEHNARALQRHTEHPMSWQAQELHQRSDRDHTNSALFTTRQEQARAAEAQGRSASSSAQPYGPSDFAPSSMWYAQPDDTRQDIDQRRVQSYNELPRIYTTYPPHLASPATGAKSLRQASGMVSSYAEAYEGTQVDGLPLARYGLAPGVVRSHTYAEDHTGRLTSTYGKRFYDSTQELQNESRRAVQEEAAMLYAHGSRMQSARSVAPQGRASRLESGLSLRHDEQDPSRLSPSHQLPGCETQSRSRNQSMPSDDPAPKRSSSSPRQERSSSRSDVQSYNAARLGDASAAASATPSRVKARSLTMKYNTAPSPSSDRVDSSKEATQSRQQQQRLYHQQRSDSDVAEISSSYETRQHSMAETTPSAPCQDEDQTVRIDRGRVNRQYPSQEQQFRAHNQQASVQQAYLPPRPVDAPSAWDEPQRPEVSTGSSQQQQQRPQQPGSFASDTRQRPPYQSTQGTDAMPNRREQQPHTSYDLSQRGNMRSDGHALRGRGGRGRPYRGGWKQHGWDDREPIGLDRASGSAGTTPAEHTANAHPGHGGRGGGEAGSGARGRGAPNRLGQR